MKKTILSTLTIILSILAVTLFFNKEEPKALLKNKCSAWDKSSKGFYWNSNGQKTLPQNIDCWDGYGRSANIKIPDNPTYENANIRFWQNTVVSGSFKIKTLSSINHTHIFDNDIHINFTDPVIITDEVILQQSNINPEKGVVLNFNKGLKGNPKCFAATSDNQYGTNKKYSYNTCSCTSSECKINKQTSRQKLIKDIIRIKNKIKESIHEEFNIYKKKQDCYFRYKEYNDSLCDS